MNHTQRLLVVVSLIAIGFILAFVLLYWGDQYGHSRDSIKIIGFSEAVDPRYPNIKSDYGIYTAYGIAVDLLGVIVPLCLFAAAAFVASGEKSQTKQTK